jgi:hypothetical protein
MRNQYQHESDMAIKSKLIKCVETRKHDNINIRNNLETQCANSRAG